MSKVRDPNKGFSWEKIKYWFIPLILLGIIIAFALGFGV